MATLTGSRVKRGLLTYTSNKGTITIITANHITGYTELPDNQLLVKSTDEAVRFKFDNEIDKDAARGVLDDAISISRNTDMEGLGVVAVGTTTVELRFAGDTKCIIVTAHPTNGAYIYVGKSDVTSDGANAIAILRAGESMTFDYDDFTNIAYVVGNSIGQSVIAGALL